MREGRAAAAAPAAWPSLRLQLLLRAGADRDLLRLDLRRLRDLQREDAVAVVRLDLLAVDTLRQGQVADERAVRPLDELRLARLDRHPRTGDRQHLLVDLDRDIL